MQIREFAFNDSGLKVITSYINEKRGTMSILYGNELALKQHIEKNGQPVEGELFRLVTFQQQVNKFWYGSTINGSLQQVETVKTVRGSDGILPAYTIEYFGHTENHGPPDTVAGIKRMLNASAAWFP